MHSSHSKRRRRHNHGRSSKNQVVSIANVPQIFEIIKEDTPTIHHSLSHIEIFEPHWYGLKWYKEKRSNWFMRIIKRFTNWFCDQRREENPT